MKEAERIGDLAARCGEIGRLRENVERVILGNETAVRLALVGLLASGHILIEDIPGVGKSTLARALARSVAGEFRRIQFTPDLLPSDITGISLYDERARDFVFRPGPVFANVLLADEINRTTPRTQSALLEAMNVGTVTVDGVTHKLPDPFLVIATENPLEFAGTYPLPESQLDRFLLRIGMAVPSREVDRAILLSRRSSDPLESLAPVLSVEEVRRLAATVRAVRVEESLLDYITLLLERTRRHRGLLLGASPRAGLGLYRAAQAHALLDGRDYVLPDDVKALAVPVWAHRLVPREQERSAAASEAAAGILRSLLDETPVPA